MLLRLLNSVLLDVSVGWKAHIAASETLRRRFYIVERHRKETKVAEKARARV